MSPLASQRKLGVSNDWVCLTKCKGTPRYLSASYQESSDLYGFCQVKRPRVL